MKKFFKSLAVLLALTLVLGVIPAAADETPELTKTSKILYVGGSNGKTADGAECTSASAVDIKTLISNLPEDAKVTLEYANPEDENTIIHIGKKATTKSCVFTGMAEVTLGTAKVNVFVDDEQIGSVDIKVKKNAIDTEEAFKVVVPEEAPVVGKTFTISMPRIIEGVKVDTDLRGLKTADENVTIVDNGNRTFDVTFAKAGSYTLTAFAYQSAKFDAPTVSKDLTFEVTNGEMAVEQTAWNQFAVTFDSDVFAKASAEATTATLTNGTAAVTVDPEVTKIEEIGAKGEKVYTYLAKAEQNGNKVTFTTFNPLKEKTQYIVSYKDWSKTFTACEWVPTSIKGFANESTRHIYPTIKGGDVQLYINVYATGENGQPVDITAKVRDTEGFTKYEATEKNDAKYAVVGNQINFYDDGIENLTVKATYTWYGETQPKELYDTFEVSSDAVRKFGVTTWGLGDWSNHAIYYEDGAMYLNVEVATFVNGKADDSTKIKNATNLRVVTSNADMLALNEYSRLAYAPKAGTSTVAVYVYYNNELVDGDPATEAYDPIIVNVYDKRVFTSLKVELVNGNSKMSYGSSLRADISTDGSTREYALDNIGVQVKVTPLDQSGELYKKGVNLTFKKTNDVLDADAASAVTIGSSAKLIKADSSFYTDANVRVATTYNTNAIVPADEKVYQFTFMIEGTDIADAKNVKYGYFAFTCKNVKNSKIVNRKLEKVNNDTQWSLIGYDAQGYKVAGLFLKNTVTGATYFDSSIVRNGDKLTKNVGKIVATGKAIRFDITYDATGDTAISSDITQVSKDAKVVKLVGAYDADAKKFVYTDAIPDAKVEAIAKHIATNQTLYVEDGYYVVKVMEAPVGSTTRTLLVANDVYTFTAPKKASTWYIKWFWNAEYVAGVATPGVVIGNNLNVGDWAPASEKDLKADPSKTEYPCGTVTVNTTYPAAHNLYTAYVTETTVTGDKITCIAIYAYDENGVLFENIVNRTLYTNYVD